MIMTYKVSRFCTRFAELHVDISRSARVSKALHPMNFGLNRRLRLGDSYQIDRRTILAARRALLRSLW